MFLLWSYISIFEALDLIGYLYKKVSILANDVYNLITRVVWQDLVLTYVSSCLYGYDMIWWGLIWYNKGNSIELVNRGYLMEVIRWMLIQFVM